MDGPYEISSGRLFRGCFGEPSGNLCRGRSLQRVMTAGKENIAKRLCIAGRWLVKAGAMNQLEDRERVLPEASEPS